MQRFFILLLMLFFPISYGWIHHSVPLLVPLSTTEQLYYEIQLEDMVSYDAFEQAMAGYEKIEASNKDILTLIDFSKPSTEERFYVIDLKQRKLLFSSHVSHGKNSGDNYAVSFSNKKGSNQSSLGFYLTGSTYQGNNGYSLILNGLEKDINDKAKERAIVIHGADYSDPSFIRWAGRLGRSQGCPALPRDVAQPIINTIKEGSLLYIYADNPDYMEHSPVLSDHAML